MKNLITPLSFLFMIFSFTWAKAQKGILYYKLTIEEKNKPRPENYVCYFSDNKSIEFFLPKALNESTVQTGSNSIDKSFLVKNKDSKQLFIYKDFLNRSLLLGDNIIFKKYLIADTLANFKWNITNEKQKILKYNCIKATTTFRGRNYIAWFTDEIAIQNGPWKFCGLPGLIVKVNDTANNYSFELEGIDLATSFDSTIIKVPNGYANDNPISHTAFMELYHKKVLEIEANNRASLKTVTTSSGTSTTQSFDTIPAKIEKY